MFYLITQGPQSLLHICNIEYARDYKIANKLSTWDGSA